MCIVCIDNNINRNVYMYLNTRIFPTTGYARVLLFMFIRRELGGKGTGCLFQFTYCDYPTYGIFWYPKRISNHLTVGPCRCLPQPHRTCINGVSVMVCLLAKTMCGRTQLTMPSADPEEGTGVRTPAPWKITNSIGLYRIMQFDPSSWEKLDPLEMLDRPSPWNIGKL